MKYLTNSAFEKAVTYLKDEARPLENVLYNFYFEDGSADDVLAKLGTFQNQDGGFGHGLEPDVQLKDSSVIATTLAFQRFRELETSADHPIVAKACQYLVNTYNADEMNWSSIPANIDDAPHAPWWEPKGALDRSLINPRAEIAGYLNDYSKHFPDDLRQQVTDAAINHLFEQPDDMEMHDLYCYIRLWETRSLTEDVRSRILDKLKRVAETTVERDPEGWKGYGLQPLSIVHTPESPFAESFRDEIQHNLDFIIDNQGENGSWMPNWTWGGNWPDAWAKAEREWSGVITIGNLRTLHTFGRIEAE